MRIFKVAAFERFARKEGIADAALCEAVDRAEKGLVDADLGGGVIKQRLARAGQGRSGSYRSILFFRRGLRTVFVYGYAKSDQANITLEEKRQFKKAATHVLNLNEAQLRVILARGEFTEVLCNGE